MNPTRLFDFIDYQNEKYPQERALTYRHKGQEKSYSSAEIAQLAQEVACGLWRLGLRPGDKIASVIVKNRPEWLILDLGMMQIGVANVPVYPTISPKEYEYIFNDASVKLCFIGDDEAGSVFKKVQQAQLTVPSLKTLYTFDKVNYVQCWTDLLGSTKEINAVNRIKAIIDSDDLATIIYTSGTTGNPKGVMLSHDNIVSNIEAVLHLMPIGAGAKVLSFLPLNHIFERVCAYNYLSIGANVVFVGIDNLGGDGGDLKAVQPAFFTTVPRLLEKVYEKLYNKGLELTGLKKKLFFWALKLTNDYEYDKTYSGLRALQHKLADKLIYSKWREALGGNLVGVLVGASACPVKILRTFSAAGIPVREGYGMTETSPGIAISGYTAGMALLGTVGPIIQGTEVRIDASDGNYWEGEGEILASGRNVMLGYYNKPVQTAEVIKMMDGKRWMCTGDVGKWVEKDGKQFLKITDRKKELFKTSGGKYVAPAPLENSLKEHFLIEQVMILGENQKFVAAIIVPAMEALRDWCGSHGVEWKNVADAIQNPAVIAAFQKAVDHYNPNFSKVEQIKKFVLIADSWEPVKADGSEAELTPTMKLKRRVILEKYKTAIQQIYA
ncbi:MAG: hypothetical protein RLZZ628_2704 [Bacteroidota bacterium]|jgi:long-chain acyl-CoA synthetase